MRVFWLFAIFASLFFATMAVNNAAYAATDILDNACQTAPDSAACKDRVGSGDENPLTGVNGVLYRASQIVAGAAGVAAVIMIIVAGFRYVNSGGDAQKAAEAKRSIIGAIVGLLVIAAAQTIITFVVRGIR